MLEPRWRVERALWAVIQEAWVHGVSPRKMDALVAVGAGETEAFWAEFCRQLVARGLHGVQLVISDAHEGLRAVLAQCFAGARWQHCTVHSLHNVVAACSRQDGPAVLALVKTVFAQPTQQAASQAISQAVELLQPRYPKLAKLLRDAAADILSHLAFPSEHLRSIRSPNVLGRVNAEIDRRATVGGISPDSSSLLRLSTAVLQDQHNEWQDGRCHFSQQSMARLDASADPALTNPLTAGLAA